MTPSLESFIQITKRPKIDCPVCHLPLKKGVAAHTGANGAKHPFHSECIESWIYTHKICPVCMVCLSSRKIKSLKEQNCAKDSSTLSQWKWQEVAESVEIIMVSTIRIDPYYNYSIHSFGIALTIQDLIVKYQNMSEQNWQQPYYF